jgi:hypothetical protein
MMSEVPLPGGIDGLKRKTLRLLKPQLLVPLTPELGRGGEFEILSTWTLEVPKDLVDTMWRKPEFLLVLFRPIAEFIEKQVGGIPGHEATAGCDAAVLTEMVFYESGGARRVEASFDLIRLRRGK